MTDDPAGLPPTIDTDDGVTLEAAWSVPPSAVEVRPLVAVMTHPHPRFGGDMHNLVPATLARELPAAGIATLRFNFRGTGRSTGSHGDGEAEIADVRTAVVAARSAFPDRAVVAVGYSFGADVLLALDDADLAAVVAIAPPLAVLAADRLGAPRGGAPTLVLAAEHDQFRPFDDAAAIVGTWPDTTVEPIAGADHFLAGAMGRVTDSVRHFLVGGPTS